MLEFTFIIKMGLIVVRAIHFNHLPDAELIVQKLKDDGTLKRLSDNHSLTIDELKKSPLKDITTIFVDINWSDFESGDIIIHENDNFEIFTGEGLGE